MLKITTDTVIKRFPVQSASLAREDKYSVKADEMLDAKIVANAEHGHYQISLDTPIRGTTTWYVYSDHVVDESQPDNINLKVPFWKQTDNLYEPQRTCNSSACSMVAKFLGAPISSDDEYYKIVRRFGDTTDHTAQTFALQSIKIKSTWRTDLDFIDLDKSLRAGIPAVIGILHRGPIDAPTGGHMIAVKGKTANGYIINDPYGSLMDAGGPYTGSPDNGNGPTYPTKILERRWTVDGKGTGWGRLFFK